MPPKQPAETADAADFSVASEVVAEARKSGYEAGYADGHKFGYAEGLVDGKPKLPLFEACKKLVFQNLSLPWPDVNRKIDALVAEYVGEKLSKPDRGLLINQYDRLNVQIGREKLNASQMAGPKPSEVTEYEVVS